jgi:aryl-alcohol dehydrogenase-like predicted oxidoreductase
MQYKNLRGTHLEISRIGLGCDMLAETFFQYKVKDPKKLLFGALDLGVNHFDTASTYGNGKSELIIGNYLNQERDKLIITTKGGKSRSKAAVLSDYFLPFAPLIRPFVNPKKNLLKKLAKKKTDFNPLRLSISLKSSLSRLKTNYVDIYLLHSPTIQELSNTPKLFETLHGFKKDGLARYIGVSVNTIEELNWILKNEHVDIVQLPYNAINSSLELGFKDLVDKNIGIISRVVFAQGLLTQKYQNQLDLSNPEISNLLQKVTESNPIEKIAAQYVSSQPAIDCTIVGTSSLQHLSDTIFNFSAP